MRSRLFVLCIFSVFIFSCEEDEPIMEFTLGDTRYKGTTVTCYSPLPNVYYISTISGTPTAGNEWKLCGIEFSGVPLDQDPPKGNYLVTTLLSSTFGYARVSMSGNDIDSYNSESGELTVSYRNGHVFVEFIDIVMKNTEDNTLKYASGRIECN